MLLINMEIFLKSLLDIFIALDILAIIALIYRIVNGFIETPNWNERYLADIIVEQDDLIAEYEKIFDFQQTYIIKLKKFYAGQITEDEMIKFLEEQKTEIQIKKEKENE